MKDVNDLKTVKDVKDECRSNSERYTNLGNVFFTATVIWETFFSQLL